MRRFEWVIPNSYYVWRCEADLLCLTKASYLYEYEIKVTKQDFKNDTNKKVQLTRHYFKEYNIKSPTRTLTQKKMFWLDEGCLPPNYFSYIVPEGLIEVEDVPEFAGLYYINNRGLLREIKKPTQLHSRKVTLEQKYKHCKKLATRVFSNLIK